VREAARTGVFWVLVAIFGLHGMALSGVMVHQLPLLESIGFNSREGASIIGLIFVLSGIGRLSAGTMLDYFDRRLVIVAVLSLQGVSIVLLATLSTSWVHVVLFALTYGSSFGSTIPARALMIREFFGERAFGSISGLVHGATIGTGLIGPLIMGAAFDLTGSYTSALLVFAGVSFAIVPLGLLLRPPSLARR
jgi:sugar phosphate permease